SYAPVVVPNGASPQCDESNHRQCATSRSLSGERSALNGIATGASTPRMRWLGDRISISGIVCIRGGSRADCNSLARDTSATGRIDLLVPAPFDLAALHTYVAP